MTELTVLVVGAIGSVGRHAVAESLRRRHRTRALVRGAGDESSLPAESRSSSAGSANRGDWI
jgi:uncharacterized protein YbjT (DUF2867 family)